MDAGSAFCPAIAGADLASPGPSLHIEDSTVIGRVWVQNLRLASNTIFYSRLGQARSLERAGLGGARAVRLRTLLLAARQLDHPSPL